MPCHAMLCCLVGGREGPVDGAANPASLLSPSASNGTVTGGTDSSPGKAGANDSAITTANGFSTPASPSTTPSIAAISTVGSSSSTISQTPRNRQGSGHGSRGAFRGVIPRAVEDTWARIRHLNESSNGNEQKIDVHVTFYEVYRGKVRDLLVRKCYYIAIS
jgi:hypothetical protein